MRRQTATNPALGLIAVVTLCGCVGASTQETVPEGTLVSVTRGDNVVGTQARFVRDVDGGRQFITRQTMRISIAGARPRTLIDEKTRTEDSEQNTVALAHVARIGRYETVTTAEISSSMAIVRRETPIETREQAIELPDGLRFDNGAGLIEGWDPSATPTLEFYALDLRAPLIERIVYRFADPRESDEQRTLLRMAYVGDDLRSLSRLFLDDTGNLTGSEQPMFGLPIQTDTEPAADTQSSVASNPVRESLIKSPYRISRDAMSGHIRYTFSLEPGVGFLPPETGEQRVTALPDGFALDICETCGPGMDSSEAALSEALEPTFWLQSDHSRLTRIGRMVGESDASDIDKMARLERWARRRMDEIDFAGHYSAAEALALRSGDCTEGAVVLAALGRAAGIPTRVASGIVYSRERYHGVSHAFMPHAWTLAWVDGEWRSFDMSLEGFDATHIALTISDGDPGSIASGHQLASLLVWEAMTEVRQRPQAESQ